MYTRCPECSTIFRVTAAQLRTALGEVSCGSCHTTFNALSALSEELPELTDVVTLNPVKDEVPADDETASEVDEFVAADDLADDDETEPVPTIPASLMERLSETPTDSDEPADALEFETPTDTDERVDALEFETPTDTDKLVDALEFETPTDADEQPILELEHATHAPDADDETLTETDVEPIRYSDDFGSDSPAMVLDNESESSGDDGEAVVMATLADAGDVFTTGTGAESMDRPAIGQEEVAADEEWAIQLTADNDEPPEDQTTGEIEVEHDKPGAEADNDPLEFDAPEQTWSDIFMPAESAPPLPSSVVADDEADDEAAATPGDEREDSEAGWSPLTALESQTADPDEWQGFLAELSHDAKADDDDTAQPIAVLEFEDTPVMPEAGAKDTEIEPADKSPARRSIAIDNIVMETSDFDDEDSHDTDDFGIEQGGIELGGIELGGVELGDIEASESAVMNEIGIGSGETEDAGESIYYDEPFADAATNSGANALPWEMPAEELQPRKRSWLAGVTAIALIAALGGQLIHNNRDALAAHPAYGENIRAIYRMLDLPLYPDWDLAAFKVSGSEAVAGRTADTALDILANVNVIGDQSVGMPMIRVVLHDRWANPVASRIFTPPEYLRDAETRPAMANPGMTLPIEISVADPGTEAQGYVVDVCLPRRTSGLECQIEKDPFQP